MMPGPEKPTPDELGAAIMLTVGYILADMMAHPQRAAQVTAQVAAALGEEM